MNKKARRLRIKHYRRSKRVLPNTSKSKDNIIVIGKLDFASAVDFMDDLALIELKRFVRISQERNDDCIVLKIIAPANCDFLLRSSFESGFLKKWSLYFSFVTMGKGG